MSCKTFTPPQIPTISGQLTGDPLPLYFNADETSNHGSRVVDGTFTALQSYDTYVQMLTPRKSTTPDLRDGMIITAG